MSKSRSPWIPRRGQLEAADAIEQVLEPHSQPGEPIHQLDDSVIDDSPYQARRPFNEADVEELAQAMREVGFQSVLIVRPHGDSAQRRNDRYQLVYGHRRRAAWRNVCAERSVPCQLPVVIRAVSDAQMLTIGAQENLQRHDLDPLEEAQIVAWHERMFFDKNQAEIGALLGKSSDWVSVRSRVHKLPNALKIRLQQRPRAISQMLELGTLYAHQPETACTLADRVVRERLSLDAVRALVRGYTRPGSVGAAPTQHAATTAQALLDVRSDDLQSCDGMHKYRGAATRNTLPTSDIHVDTTPMDVPHLVLLQEAAAALAIVAAHAATLPYDAQIEQAVAHAEQALAQIRQALRTPPPTEQP